MRRDSLYRPSWYIIGTSRPVYLLGRTETGHTRHIADGNDWRDSSDIHGDVERASE